VGPRRSLGVGAARLDAVRWTGIARPERPFAAEAVLRYRARPVAVTVVPAGEEGALLSFREPAWPVTPGQVAVVYRGDVVAGAGRIRRGSSGPAPA